MFSQLESLLQTIDRAVASITEQYPDEVQCRPGCADCCHAVFDISFIEAAYIAAYLQDNRTIVEDQQEAAGTAAVAFEELMKNGDDPSKARIRCPLLGENDLCLAHTVRPINCRTYGTPTIIEGRGHVCGWSGFQRAGSYPTIDLAPLQMSLREYSAELAGEQFRHRRFPLAWVLLRTDFFLPGR